MEAYKQLINDVHSSAQSVLVEFSFCDSERGLDDGRIVSAIKELDFLSKLEEKLSNLKDRRYAFVIAPPRNWFDFSVNNIPFNLKLTTGSTDNVFNKMAIVRSITNHTLCMKYINWTNFAKLVNDRLTTRIPEQEYHFLVCNKHTNKCIVRSLLDIVSFRSNPSNILQVNWKTEFERDPPEISINDVGDKQLRILQTIQKSILDQRKDTDLFASFQLTR